MTIALAADGVYAKQLSVVLASLHASQAAPYRVFILYTGFDDELRHRVVSGFTEHTVTWIAVDVGRLSDIQLPAYLPIATVFRLLAPVILPPEIQRVIYLDADLIVREPLDGLWSADLGDHPVAAVRDAVTPWVGSPKAMPWHELGLAPTSPYFNAGVLLIDLHTWLRSDISTRALEVMRRRRLRHGDQCGLKVAVGDHVLQLPPRWNLQAGHLLPDESSAWLVEDDRALNAAITSPAIAHFNTSSLGRPWSSGCSHPLRTEWLEALDRTRWSGWRPSLARELLNQLREGRAPQRILQRLHVAGHVLVRGE